MGPERVSTALPRLRDLAPDPRHPARVEVKDDGAVLSVCDRGTRLTYELVAERTPRNERRRGRGSGAGWIEIVRLAGERTEGRRAVAASEPFAYLAQFGREDEVFRATARAIRELASEARAVDERVATASGERRRALRARAASARNQARRLVAELRSGIEGERIGVRELQGLVLSRLEDGQSLSELCRAGGFGETKPDTGWLQRRLGLEITICSRTGKRFFARTIEHTIAARVCRALEVDPIEVGL